MGNVSSAEPRPASEDKTATSDGSPKRMVSSTFRSRSVKADELCRALRDRGRCISESEMEEVLAKHSNVMDAIAYAIESGMTRKLARTQRGQVSRTSSGGGGSAKKRPQENIRPHLATSSVSPTSKKVNQKRSRPGETEGSAPDMMAGSRGERPLKRPAVMRGSFVGIVSAEMMKREATDSVDRAAKARGGVRVDEDTGGVLTVLQQGSPPRHRLGRSREILPLKRDNKSNTGFVQVPDELNLGAIDYGMIQAVERWAERAPDQKEAAVREVIKSLHLNALGAERKERLDEDLVPLIHAAMDYLAQQPTIERDSISKICIKVREARMIGHNVTKTVMDKYDAEYGSGSGNGNTKASGGGGRSPRSRSSSRSEVEMDGRTARTNNNDNHGGSLSPLASRLTELEPVHSPTSPTPVQSPPTSLSPSTPTYDAPPSPSGSARGSARAGGRSSQRSGQHHRQPYRHFGSRSSSNDSRGAPTGSTAAGNLFSSLLPRKASPTRRPPPPPQGQGRKEAAAAGEALRKGQEQIAKEKAMHAAWVIFRAALTKIISSRQEEEWLECQVEVVKKTAKNLQRKDDKNVLAHQERVNSARQKLEDAANAVEEATTKVIGPIEESSNTIDEALRSLIDSLPQQSERSLSGGRDPLEPRRRAVSVKEAAGAKLEEHRKEMMLVTHGADLSKVLFDGMFGDLTDRISTMQRQAYEQKIAHQETLKSTAKALLEKYDAVRSQITEKHAWAKQKRDKLLGKVNREKKFIPEESNTHRATKANLQEVENFVTDSVETMRLIDTKMLSACASLKYELPEADLHSLTDGLHPGVVRLFATLEGSLQTGQDMEKSPMG